MTGRAESDVFRNLSVLGGASRARPWQAVLPWVRSHLFTMGLGAVGLGVLTLHVEALTSSPPGFYVDEATVGYSAYAISVDGRDEHGESWPLFIEAFGGYKNPVIIYLMAGVMRFFGPSVAIVRMVPTLLSLLTAIALGLLAYQIFHDRWLGLATFAAAGTLPWLFIIGRIGFEVSALPTALALFLLAWWNAVQERSNPRRQLLMAVLAGLSLGVAIYAYTTGRLLILILVMVLGAAYLGEWRRRWRPLAVTSFIGLASYLPMAIWSLQHPGQLTGRFSLLSIFCRPVSTCYGRPPIVGNTDDGSFFPLVVAERLLSVYASGWSPSFLFYTGDPWGRHVTGHGGMLYVTLAPFLIVGAIALVRRFQEPFWRLIGLGAVFAAIPAALTMDHGHALRFIAVVPFLIIVMALGAAELIRLLAGQRWIAIGLGLAFLVEMGAFMIDYFTDYPSRQAVWFDPGLETAIATAEQTPHQGAIRLSGSIDQAPTMFAFFTHQDPRTYRANGIAGGGGVVLPVVKVPLPPRSVVVAKPDENVLNGELMQTVTLPGGGDGWGHPAKAGVYYNVWLTR
jgi:hypothetical protein